MCSSAGELECRKHFTSAWNEAPDESNLLQKRGNSQAMTFPEPLSAPLASPKLPEAPAGPEAMKIATENLTLPQTCQGLTESMELW